MKSLMVATLFGVVVAGTAFGQGPRDAKLMLKIRLVPTSDHVVNYQDIEPLLNKYYCDSCHTGHYIDPDDPEITYADIDMTTFPFGLAKLDETGTPLYDTQAQLVDVSLERFRHEDSTKVMPQPPQGREVELVSEADESLFRAWLAADLPARPDNVPALDSVVATVKLHFQRFRRDQLDEEGDIVFEYDPETNFYVGWLPGAARRDFKLAIEIFDADGAIISEIPQWDQRFSDLEFKYYHAVDVQPVDNDEDDETPDHR